MLNIDIDGMNDAIADMTSYFLYLIQGIVE